MGYPSKVNTMKSVNPQSFYVYAHYRGDTGKIFYVGKGRGKRFESSNRTNPYWNSVVDKHGFNKRILLKNLSEQCSLSLEKIIIHLHGRYPDGPLVNMTDGGEGTSGWSPSKEWRNRRSEMASKSWEKEGYRENINIKLKSIWDDERRKSYSELSRKRWESIEYRERVSKATSKGLRAKGRPIISLCDGREFGSMAELCEFYGVKHGDVRRVLTGKQGSVKGMAFHYSDEKPKKWNGRSLNRGKVYCVELNKWFDSASTASKELNISPGNLSSVLSGKLKTTGGMRFIREK